MPNPSSRGALCCTRSGPPKLRTWSRRNKYRSAVLTAFQNVADTLNALAQDADALKTAAAAEGAAKVTLELTRQQLQFGSASVAVVLSAEQTYQQARITLVQAQANRYADTAALFQALGGGWWHRSELTRN